MAYGVQRVRIVCEFLKMHKMGTKNELNDIIRELPAGKVYK